VILDLPGIHNTQKALSGTWVSPQVNTYYGRRHKFPGRFFKHFPHNCRLQRLARLNVTRWLVNGLTSANQLFDKQEAMTLFYDRGNCQVCGLHIQLPH
jgi:hypothetical protein